MRVDVILDAFVILGSLGGPPAVPPVCTARLHPLSDVASDVTRDPAASDGMASVAAGIHRTGASRGNAVPVFRCGNPVVGPAHAALVFQGVTVVDVTDGQLVPAQTVVIVGPRIQAIGPVDKIAVPAGAQVIDAQGTYMIPGLWDMHAHVDAGADAFYPLFVAHGVTGIREMAQRFSDGASSFRTWQQEVMAGTRVGPRAIGPSADLSYRVDVSTPDRARQVMDSLQAAGDVFVKFHAVRMPRDLFFAILREARRVGLPVVGHVPRQVTNVEAADSGMRSIEHTAEHHQCALVLVQQDSATAEAPCREVAAAYIRNDTWLGTTLILEHHGFRGKDPRVQATPGKLVRTMRRLGVTKLLAGTDCATEMMLRVGAKTLCYRGSSLPQELALLVEAGLTPLEALQTATLNPAKFLHATDSLGTVAPGKLADLVLLEANPLADITNVTKLQAVVANGRYFDRATLAGLRAEFGPATGMP